MRTFIRLFIGCCLAVLTTWASSTEAIAQQDSAAAQVFKRLDRDGDGRITPTELRNRRAFEALDTDADGAITAAEAREVLAKASAPDRRKLANVIRAQTEEKDPILAQPTDHRATYSKDLRVHVGVLGVSDGQPLTDGDDFKPVWSKTGDTILFFRRVVNHPVTGNWKTAICVINADGTGFHQLSDGTHTDFNQTWTRDGTNTPIWNRKKPGGRGYTVMASKIGGQPGEEYPISDPSYPTWAYSSIEDGRILVSARHPGLGRGYYLMTPAPGETPNFERIDCELARTGILDRISIAPSETKVCFEYQKGFDYEMSGRTLYVADFDAEELTISNAKPFANEEGKPVWFAYPRWTRDESAIVYHAGGKLFLYKLEDGSTVKVSTDDGASYIYPHGEATPK